MLFRQEFWQAIVDLDFMGGTLTVITRKINGPHQLNEAVLASIGLDDPKTFSLT